MIHLRRGTVTDVRAAHPGLADIVVDVDGLPSPAIAYVGLTGPVAPGDVVIVNTTAVDLGLGTGGAHIVVAVEGKEYRAETADAHAMKLRYTPHQPAVAALEETHREAIDAVTSLAGKRVVIAGLHSALAPACVAAQACAPGARIAYVMTDAAALHMAFSRTVPALREAGLLHHTITTGQATGGDDEAVTVFGALAGARAVLDADLVVVAMGPGNLGTGSRWGTAALETGTLVNAVAAMGGAPIVVPRISFADARPRHHGVSHHTRTALETIALARATIALPILSAERAAIVKEQLAAIARTHDIVEVDLGPAEDALRTSPVPLRSMGRAYPDDPDHFRAAAAAAVFALAKK